MSGVIEGGWNYVAAAWILSVVGLIGYSAFINLQLRAAARADQDARGGPTKETA